ncbi:MAG: hypothetical protein ACYC3I_03555 [Gemmataceae bacterium]
MNVRSILGASLATALLLGGALAEESLKSGPQVGKKVTPFNPLHVTGSTPGEKFCLV